jgi:hypothetical protein
MDNFVAAFVADQTGTAQFPVFAAPTFPDANLVPDIFDAGVEIQVAYREHIAKNLLQSTQPTIFGGDTALKKGFERFSLDLNKIRNINNLRDTSEVFSGPQTSYRVLRGTGF